MPLNFEQDDARPDETDTDENAVSLEELSQTYANLLHNAAQAGQTPPNSDDEPEQPSQFAVVGQDLHGSPDGSPPSSKGFLSDDENDSAVTPRSILEAILFVGRPDGGAITAAEIAGLMRGVQAAEIVDLAGQLNASYQQNNSAIQIYESADGFRLGLAHHAEHVRNRFYGRARTVSLNQAAIDCLALIAYQPGISRQQLDEQRGQSSGGVLNQLVRRQLIEIHREVVDKKSVVHYHPTDKLVQLAGLASLEDLPQVEELE